MTSKLEHLIFEQTCGRVYIQQCSNVESLKFLPSYQDDVPGLHPYPELLKQFKDMLGFKENGDNIEAIPQRIVDLENRRNEIENAADIDFSAGGRNGVSYRALPKEFDHLKCSGRTALCDEVQSIYTNHICFGYLNLLLNLRL
ncbi:paired amphipathic helix protein Sin3a [Trichonephila inaurata madagascariensis]|uniref:Paired amphipathic helix protein Sin3a n=1 Tax=Trichonephila inaurata madagascariensis TaxID=2747483 RepID=A0A8X7C4V9_9ARAC|nr:paired amphipathic helix protein Sin3a [Trichonephila inaurata madagascariensis]